MTTTFTSAKAAQSAQLRQAWSDERDAAGAARRRGDPSAEWTHLERAHILSQPMVVPHLRTHVAMLAPASGATTAGRWWANCCASSWPGPAP